MEFETSTGVGYFVDSEGRVMDYYDLQPGTHMLGGDRSDAVDVSDRSNLPEIDDAYK